MRVRALVLAGVLGSCAKASPESTASPPDAAAALPMVTIEQSSPESTDPRDEAGRKPLSIPASPLRGKERPWSLPSKDALELPPVAWEYPVRAGFSAPRFPVGVRTGDLVILRTDGELTAIDAKSGSERWSVAHRLGSYAKVYPLREALLVSESIVSGGKHADAGITAFDPAAGRHLWTTRLGCRLNGAVDSAPGIAAGSCTIEPSPFIAKSDHRSTVVALDLRSGRKVWERDIQSGPAPVVADQHTVYIQDSARCANEWRPGVLFAVDATTGALKWKIPSQSLQLLRVGGTLLGGVARSAADGHVLWSAPQLGLYDHPRSLPLRATMGDLFVVPFRDLVLGIDEHGTIQRSWYVPAWGGTDLRSVGEAEAPADDVLVVWLESEDRKPEVLIAWSSRGRKVYRAPDEMSGVSVDLAGDLLLTTGRVPRNGSHSRGAQINVVTAYRLAP